MRIVPLALILTAAAVVGAGCRRDEPLPPPPPPPPVSWFAADSTAAADKLATEVLKRPWINEFRDRTARVPVLRVGPFNDKSDGEVNISVFTADLAKALSRSTTLRVAESDGPADFSLVGAVAFQEAEAGAVRYYQLDLKLVDAKGEAVGTPIAIEQRKDNAPAK